MKQALWAALWGVAATVCMWAPPARAQYVPQPVSINPDNITIYRDDYGVPHIYANTDAEVAYGLAWAHCEDDFYHIQENLISTRGRMGEISGVAGAGSDYFLHFINARATAEAQWPSMDPKFRTYLEAFAAGANAYAAKHPDQVRLKGLFPVSALDVATGFVYTLAGMVGAGDALAAIAANRADKAKFNPGQAGSNAFAIRSNKSATGKTFLVINPHVPLEGAYSFYEVHLHSNEGLNIHGALFPGAPVPGMGVTPNLGWALTFNWPDYCDVYKMKLNPKNENQYWYDGKWQDFTIRTVKLKVKVAGIKLTVKRTVYDTPYGPAYKNKSGIYAVRYVQNQTARAGEQWYDMAKATSLAEFQAALRQQFIPHFNVVYADKQDNIYYLFNALLPKRNPNPAYNWASTLPGDTSATLWTQYFAFDDLPQVLNPACGYVYNTNNTPFHTTCDAEVVDSTRYPANLSMWWNYRNNRDVRFRELIATYDKLTYDDLKAIKFDNAYPQHLPSSFQNIVQKFKEIDPAKYPHIAQALAHINAWDYTGERDNRHAGLVLLSFYHAFTLAGYGFNEIERGIPMPHDMMIKGVEYGQKLMLKYHGRLDAPLGDVQRHIRGQVDLPMQGLPETLAAIYALEDLPKGRLRVTVGDTYTGFAQFGPQGLERFETQVPYGASNVATSPHYTDQMQLYIDEKTKPVELDHNKVKQAAKTSYHPK